MRNSPDGKWHHSEKLSAGKIWDCSNCEYPHIEDTVRVHLEKVFKSRSRE